MPFIVCCHDHTHTQVSLPLTATLDSLKAAILRCPALPTRTPAASSKPKPKTIPEMYGIGIKSQMRLFHLGRELKSSGRSLGALGIGRFDNYLVHLAAGGVQVGHGNGGASSGRKRKAVGASGSTSGSGGGTTVEPVEIDSSDDDDDDEVIELDDSQESSAGGKTPAAAASAASSSSGGGGPGEVIDLLDDSDDDDDADGGAGGTSGAAAGKRQRA